MRLFLILGMAMLPMAAQSPRGARIAFDQTSGVRLKAFDVRVAGGVELNSEAMTIDVDRCDLTRGDRSTEATEVVSVRAGLSRNIEGNAWGIQRSSPRYSIGHSFTPGERLELKRFALQIPMGGFEIEPGDWLTFEFASMSERNGKKTGSFFYVQVHLELPSSVVPRKSTTVVPFEIDSDPVMHGVAVRIVGQVERNKDALKIVVSKCVFAASPQYPAESRSLVSIGASITRSTTSSSFRPERSSEPHLVELALPLGETIELPPFELAIDLIGLAIQPFDLLSFPIRDRLVESGRTRTESFYVHAMIRIP